MDKAGKEPAYSTVFDLSDPLGSPRVASSPAIPLGADVGGTFTDVASEVGDRRYTAKKLTTARIGGQVHCEDTGGRALSKMRLPEARNAESPQAGNERLQIISCRTQTAWC
jgi:hypothetical protein